MNYHNIEHDNMLNGEGLRVVLFVSGCENNCHNCQNPQTHDPKSGTYFDEAAYEEICEQLRKPYISGLTLSGGDPFYPTNRIPIYNLIQMVKKDFPNKTIWAYTGYRLEKLLEDTVSMAIINKIDVLCDGSYFDSFKDVNIPWVGSSNQRVIDMQKTLDVGSVVLYGE